MFGQEVILDILKKHGGKAQFREIMIDARAHYNYTTVGHLEAVVHDKLARLKKWGLVSNQKLGYWELKQI